MAHLRQWQVAMRIERQALEDIRQLLHTYCLNACSLKTHQLHQRHTLQLPALRIGTCSIGHHASSCICLVLATPDAGKIWVTSLSQSPVSTCDLPLGSSSAATDTCRQMHHRSAVTVARSAHEAPLYWSTHQPVQSTGGWARTQQA